MFRNCIISSGVGCSYFVPYHLWSTILLQRDKNGPASHGVQSSSLSTCRMYDGLLFLHSNVIGYRMCVGFQRILQSPQPWFSSHGVWWWPMSAEKWVCGQETAWALTFSDKKKKLYQNSKSKWNAHPAYIQIIVHLDCNEKLIDSLLILFFDSAIFLKPPNTFLLDQKS